MDSSIIGFLGTTWTPGKQPSLEEIATTVGFWYLPSFHIPCKNSNELSSSQSNTMRSVLPFANKLSAFDGLRQTCVQIDRSRSSRLKVQNTPESCVRSKHSNAMSGVM